MDARIKDAIPAHFVMLSGSEDKQTSADVGNVGSFSLPDPAGKAGGACTSALLKVINENRGNPMSWIDLLQRMRSVLKHKGFDQIPQLSSSRMLDVNNQFEIVPQSSRGRRRAVLIGINYEGQQGQLSGCHNDANNIKRYLIKKQGFKEKDMLILMDDGRHHQPTKRNILEAFDRVVEYSQAGDVVFIHYSGHGGRVRDTSGDEADGYDEVRRVLLLASIMIKSCFRLCMTEMLIIRFVSNLLFNLSPTDSNSLGLQESWPNFGR